MAITVTLDGDGEALAREMVERGCHPSLADAATAGLRLEAERQVKLARFWAGIDEAVADVEAGRVYEPDEVAEELSARYSDDRDMPDAA